MKKIFCLLFILFLTLALRVTTFWEGKVTFNASGDEKSYLGLALKIENNKGLKEYNLQGIEYYKNNGFLFLSLSKDKKGRLLKERNRDGFKLDDQIFYFSPPLFPQLLSLSHLLCCAEKDYVLSLRDRGDKHVSSFEVVKKQLYAVVVPFLLSILTVLAVYFLGNYLFSESVAFYAALFMLVSPIDILASHRIWADTLLGLLTTLTLWFFYLFLRKKTSLFFYLSAVTCALGLLTKNNALIVLFNIVLVYIMLRCGMVHLSDYRKYDFLNLKKLVLFFSIIVIIVFSWYFQVFKHYGTFFYNPSALGIEDVHSFFKWINNRPWYTYLIDIPYQNPMLIFGYFYIVFSFMKEKSLNNFLLIIWFLSFFVLVTVFTSLDRMTGPDNRYILPAYPALCLLSANFLSKLKGRLLMLPLFLKRTGLICLNLFVIISILWSIRIGTLAVKVHAYFLPIPF